MNPIRFFLRKLNKVELRIDGTILEYSNRYMNYRIDKSRHTNIEWTCGGYRMCFSDGTRKTYCLTLLSKKEEEEVERYFNNVKSKHGGVQ